MSARCLRSLPNLALMALFAVSCGSEAPRPGYPPRHLLLITVAGLHADHTSFHLYPRPTTWLDFDGGQRALGKALSLDDLAREGVNFARAFSPAGETSAALSSLLTGRSPLEHGVLDGASPLPADVPTLAEVFAADGFETVAFISAPETGPVAGLERGFGRFFRGASDVEALGQAVTWVTKRDWGTGQSTFAWVHLRGPTFPFEPGSFPGKDGPVDYASLFGDPAYAGPADGGGSFRAGAPTLTPEDAQRIVALYDGEVALTNRALVYFLDYYLYVGQQSALWRESVFAFAGLQGVSLPALGRHPGSDWGRTDTLGEGVQAVPLILRHPDSLTGSRVLEEIVDLADLAPTLLDWFELSAPTGASGRSLLAVTDSYIQRPFASGPALAWAADGSWSLRTERYRLRLSVQPNGQRELDLHDLERDPTEREDLAPSRPDLVAELLGVFERYLVDHPLHPSLLERGFRPARPGE